MNNEITLKNYLTILAVFIFVMISIATPFYINISKNNTTQIKGIVTTLGTNYIIVNSIDNKTYRLETQNKYNIGDFLLIDIRHLDRAKKPITGIITKAKPADINNHEDKKIEEDIVTYLKNINNKLDNYEDTEENNNYIKNSFIDVIDFIFYNKEMKGTTFQELTDTLKLKVLESAYIVDSKIEKQFPEYKEEISKTSSKIYSDVKTRILTNYLELTSKVCEANEEACISAKEGLTNLKTNFSLTWDTIKSLAGLNTSKVKNWYEIWKTIE